MSYLGDYTEDYATLNFKFTTRTTAGVPSTLGGTPVISVYKANGVTQSTAGVTLTADFDTVTGLNNVLIDLSADAFYAVANDYQVVITTGTVNSVSVVGEVVAEFSIENRFMRGTDSAALASVATEARLAELDAANIPADIDDLTTAVGSLSVGTAAISITAESFTKSGAEPETLTYTATHALDGTVHLVEDVAGAIDGYYQFDIGTEGVPVEFRWDGYCNIKDDVFAIYAYNYSTPAYEQIGSIIGINGTTVTTESFPTTINHVGTGVDLGKVRFRAATASGAAIGTDRVLCSYAVVPISGQTKGTVVDATPAAGDFDTDLTEPDGHWDDALVTFTSGTLAKQTRPIAGYLNANGNLTFNSGSDVFTASPANGDTFIVVHDHVHPVAQIVGAVVADPVIAELTTQGDTNEAKLDIITTDTNELQVAHTGGNLGVDVDKINGVSITGDGNATPFDVV